MKLKENSPLNNPRGSTNYWIKLVPMLNILLILIAYALPCPLGGLERVYKMILVYGNVPEPQGIEYVKQLGHLAIFNLALAIVSTCLAYILFKAEVWNRYISILILLLSLYVTIICFLSGM